MFTFYSFKYFYSTYEDNKLCRKSKFKTILKCLFEVIVDEILKGNHVKIPYLGTFSTIQKKRTKKSIDHHLTKINKQNGVENPVVYRTNEYYYAFRWDKELSYSTAKYHPKKDFLFNPSAGNERKIPKYHDILELIHGQIHEC